MASTSATFGKNLIEKMYYGKVAASFWYPGKGALRIALRNEFSDSLSPHEFFKYRKKGIEPSEIPHEVRQDIINMVLRATNEDMFNVEMFPDFEYQLPKSSFNKEKCEVCGEYVFERYLRVKDGKKVCIPCSGHSKDEVTRPKVK